MNIKLLACSTLCIVNFLFSPLVCQAQGAAPNPAQPTPQAPAQPPQIISSANRGYQIAINPAKWQMNGPWSVGLSFSFVVEHPDGTPVTFTRTDGAVSVTGETDTEYSGLVEHTSIANFDQNSSTWSAYITGLNPHDNVAHLTFDIRDPAATDAQTSVLTSDVRFEGVPVPTREGILEPLSDTFTTNWGTVFKLNGLTLNTSAQNGAQTIYNFTVDHTKVTDDVVQIQFQKAFDNGIQIDNLWGGGQDQPTADSSITVTSSSIAPGLHTSLSFDFTVTENASSKARSISWTPVSVDVPITGFSQPSSQTSIADQSSATVDGTVYTLQHVTDPQWGGNGESFILWSQAADPSKLVKFTSASWSRSITAQPNQYFDSDIDLTDYVWWHVDGSESLPGEFGTYFRQDNNNNQAFPLIFTAVPVTHEQETIAFSKVPFPTNGSIIILDQKPDSPSNTAIELRSVSWNLKSDPRYGYGNNNQQTNTLVLNFQYNVQDGSIVSLGTLSAVDSAGNSLGGNLENGQIYYGDTGRALADRLNQTATLVISVPPTDGSLINLSLLLAKDTPAGPATRFSVTSDSKWTVLPAPQ